MRSLEQIGSMDSGQTAVDNKSADENDSGCSKG